MIQPRILARLNRDDFVGRDAELARVVRHSAASEGAGLVLTAAPGAGCSELLRQAYDRLFVRRGNPVPIHFALRRDDATPAHVATRFFQEVLQQYVAYRRVDPALCVAPLTFNELLEAAPSGDYALVSKLIESFGEPAPPRDFVSFCFGLPHRLAKEGKQTYLLIDCLNVPPFPEAMTIARELVSSLNQAGGPFALGALRRQAADLIHADDGSSGSHEQLHIENLRDEDAWRLVDVLARRHQVETDEATRDLVVQQLNGSPFFVNEIISAARFASAPLTSFLNCQRVYVNDLLGGGIKRYFDRMLETISLGGQTQKTLLRVMFEAAISDTSKASLWTWKKRLGLDAAEFERAIEALHVYELVNSTAAFIEVNGGWQIWMDYLRTQYRLEVAAEPRAKVVGTTLVDALKRAPQTMTRKYRRDAALGLRELLSQFDCQSVPATLFHYDRFASSYRGEPVEAIDRGLDGESDLIRLPQVVQAAAALAYSTAIACEAERCVVAHAFEAGEYTTENEVVWLVAEIDSKLAASRELTQEWCDRLSGLARECGFERVQLWLVASEGFSAPASKLLNGLKAFGSSRQQVERLAARIAFDRGMFESPSADEYEMVIPMSADTELIAARTVEQIARRVNFGSEAINQIKTALVEACINAAEHSLSPDRKIYQRFIVEDDRLVIIVASRGVMPVNLAGQNGQGEDGDQDALTGRRGLGLKLIKTLMDEVEFKRVDDRIQLRMTKYVR